MCGSYVTQTTWSHGSIYTDAFYGCTSLMTLDMSRVTTKPKLASSVFANTPLADSSYTGSYGSIYVALWTDGQYTMSGNAGSWISLSKRVTMSVPEAVVPEYVSHSEPYSIYDSVATYIPRDMYASDSYLTSITFTNVVSIAMGAFKDCVNLSYISLPQCEVIGETGSGMSLTGAFYRTAITSLYLPKCSYVDGFDSCYSLATISLPVATDVNGFDHCIVKKLSLPSARYVDGFNGADQLSSISLSEVAGIHGFYGCYSLITVSLPSAYDVEDAFGNCRNLTTLRLSVAQSLGNNSFYSCYSLTNIYMPNANSYDFDAVIFERTQGDFPVLTIHVPSDMVEELKSRYPGHLSRIRFVAA